MNLRINTLSNHAQSWLKSPAAAGMGQMSKRLTRSIPNSRLHTSLLREVLLAKRLSAEGFSVRSEIPTQAGRSCDLVAVRGSLVLHLHVKCMDADDDLTQPRSPRIPSAIRSLENVDRRLLIEVEWKNGLSSSALQTTADSMRNFLGRAAVGDECVVRSRSGEIRGRCRVRSPRDTGGVSLTSGITDDHRLAVDRVRRLLRKARDQFLAGGENIIVVFGPKSAKWIFSQALLGTPVERWDEYPRRGERVALGNADDGFWTGTGKTGCASGTLSRIAVWASLDSVRDDSVAWIRSGVTSVVRGACAELFRQVLPTNR